MELKDLENILEESRKSWIKITNSKVSLVFPLTLNLFISTLSSVKFYFMCFEAIIWYIHS